MRETEQLVTWVDQLTYADLPEPVGSTWPRHAFAMQWVLACSRAALNGPNMVAAMAREGRLCASC